MKNPGHHWWVSRGVEQEKKVVELRPNIRVSAQPASPSSTFQSSPDTPVAAGILWQAFVNCRDRAQASNINNIADGIEAGHAWARFIDAFLRPDQRWRRS
jgi:hypothetical protein